MKQIVISLMVAMVIAVGGAGYFVSSSALQAAPANAFVMSIKTDNSGTSSNVQFTIPTTGGGYNYNVVWGDGQTDSGVTGSITHTYAAAGTYDVEITGTFPRIFFNGGGDAEKVLEVSQWGTIAWSSMDSAFEGASNMDITASDTPDFSSVESASEMFKGASSLTADLPNWITEEHEVLDLSSMFEGATSFNGDITSWEVFFVGNMSNMFRNATAFNQDISVWQFEESINTAGMFQGATAFNQPIDAWRPTITDINHMFDGATVFNQSLANWRVGNVGDFENVFRNATAFDQDLGSWDITSAEDATGMFEGVTLSITNYDNLLIDWEAQVELTDVEFSGGNSVYCNGETARDVLTATSSWIISDGGKDCSAVPELTLSTTTFAENNAANTAVAIASTTNAGAGETFTYALSGSCEEAGSAGDNGSFTISENQVLIDNRFDFEVPNDGEGNVLNLCLRSTGSDGGVIDQAFVINVIDVNEAPTDITIAGGNGVQIAEQQALSTVVGVLAVVDDGEDNTVQLAQDETYTFSQTCSVAGADDVHFSVNGTDLEVDTVFDFANPVDADSDNEYETCIRVTETNGGLSYDEVLRITIQDPDDTDGDGVGGSVEDAAINGGDGNGDGTLDSAQAAVSSRPNVKTARSNSLAIQNTADCSTVSRFVSLDETSLSAADADFTYPLGLWDFTIACGTPGDTAQITIFLDDVYDTDTFVHRKFDSGSQTYTDITDEVTYATAAVGALTVSTISYSVTDGGPLDADGVANGTIVDPAGPAVADNSSNGSGSGGVLNKREDLTEEDQKKSSTQETEIEVETDQVTETVLINFCPIFTLHERVGVSSNEVFLLSGILQVFNLYSGELTKSFTPQIATGLHGLQERFTEQILTPWGLTESTGYKYKTTNKFLNELLGCDQGPVYLEGVGEYAG